MKKLTYHVWTIKEITLLKKMAEMISTKEAAEQLGVPHFAVKNACHKYRISFVRKHFFKKGHRTWNKGIKKPYKGGEQTQFKKGQLPHNTRFDGAIRIQPDKSGRSYKHIRISLSKWMPLHRYIWTQVYGDPGSNVIRFKDGNSLNCDIENLSLISRGDNAKLNALIRKPRTKTRLVAY